MAYLAIEDEDDEDDEDGKEDNEDEADYEVDKIMVYYGKLWLIMVKTYGKIMVKIMITNPWYEEPLELFVYVQ